MRNESVPDVLVLGGRALVEGEVRGDVVVFGGGARIDGHVEGDVISVGNDVELGAEAEVERDVVAVGGKVRRADGARVGGRVSELDVAPGFDFNAPSWSWARRGVDWAERGAWGWGSWERASSCRRRYRRYMILQIRPPASADT